MKGAEQKPHQFFVTFSYRSMPPDVRSKLEKAVRDARRDEALRKRNEWRVNSGKKFTVGRVARENWKFKDDDKIVRYDNPEGGYLWGVRISTIVPLLEERGIIRKWHVKHEIYGGYREVWVKTD